MDLDFGLITVLSIEQEGYDVNGDDDDIKVLFAY